MPALWPSRVLPSVHAGAAELLGFLEQVGLGTPLLVGAAPATVGAGAWSNRYAQGKGRGWGHPRTACLPFPYLTPMVSCL